MPQDVARRYEDARERYAQWGVDTEAALDVLSRTPVSIHCWQADDVGGFERRSAPLASGGIQVTGSHPGLPRSPQQLREDLEMVLSLVPGRHRINLHAIYGEFAHQPADRDAIRPEHFRDWMDWASARGLALDFNATLFAHPHAADGYTLSHPDLGLRTFWIEHVRRCREIATEMGRRQTSPCLHNLWIPDGDKDHTAPRARHREWLRESLDAIYSTRADSGLLCDSVESKLFGIGSESFVVGSHEFYLAYALTRGLLPCLDMGHFHPTESLADKITALLPFFPELALHVSRPVRWDSDHVVIHNDDLSALMLEIVRAGALSRIRLALDFFDGSMNRVGAYVIGIRATQKALLAALLEPWANLDAPQYATDRFARLACLEEFKSLPMADVWAMFCEREGRSGGTDWIAQVQAYQRDVCATR